jgi:hypothetical protein
LVEEPRPKPRMQAAGPPPTEQPDLVAEEVPHALFDAIEDLVPLGGAETSLVDGLLKAHTVLLDEGTHKPVHRFLSRCSDLGQRSAAHEACTELRLREAQVVGRGPEDLAERACEARGPTWPPSGPGKGR